MEPITLVLVVLGVLVALSAIGAVVYVYRARQASAKEGEITPQFVSPGPGAGGQYYPAGYWAVGYWPKYGTNAPATTGRVHTEVLWQHPVMEH